MQTARPTGRGCAATESGRSVVSSFFERHWHAAERNPAEKVEFQRTARREGRRVAAIEEDAKANLTGTEQARACLKRLPADEQASFFERLTLLAAARVAGGCL